MPKCTECGNDFALEAWDDHETEICYRCQAVDNDFACDSDESYDEWDEGEDEWDEAADECGLLPPHLGGGCTLGGTEHCDFECPFRDTSHSSHGDLLE